MTQRQHIVPLRGGLDLASPPWQVRPGRCIAAQNMIADSRGYVAVPGYERFDGRTLPSASSYWILEFDAGTAAFSSGDTVTGATSGATGVALQDATVESGSYSGGDATGYLVLGFVSGTFQDNENLQVSAATKCVSASTAFENAAETVADDYAFRVLARDTQRANIGQPSGSGPVRGVFCLNGDIYCIRDNAGATAGVIHKATTSGWSVVTTDTHYFYFTTGGGSAPEEGSTISDTSSGDSATLHRVVLTGGSYSGGDAEGWMIVEGPLTGTAFQAGDNISWTGTGPTTATVHATQDVAEVTLPAGGKYEVAVHNFFGALKQPRAYFVNGVGVAHEFDGTRLTPIPAIATSGTGVFSGSDAPSHIAQYQDHLWLGYEAGVVLCSGLGAPLDWRAAAGAAEFNLGSGITNMIGGSNTALVITGITHVGYIEGTSSADFVQNIVTDRKGAIEWSAVQVDQPWYLDATGLRTLASDDSYGGFSLGTPTPLVESLFQTKSEAGAGVVGAYRVFASDQIRFLYDDKTAVAFYLGRGEAEAMTYQFEDMQPFVVMECEGTTLIGDVALCGSDGGWVYVLDSGQSFDGDEYTAFVRLSYDPIESPRTNKRFHAVHVETDGPDSIEIALTMQTNFSQIEAASPAETVKTQNAVGGIWNASNYGSFVWSAPEISASRFDVAEFGSQASVALLMDVHEQEPPAIHTITIDWSLKGAKRV